MRARAISASEQVSRPPLPNPLLQSACLALGRTHVARISNLLYRRFPIGSSTSFAGPTSSTPCRLEALRYSRLEICATLNGYPPKEERGPCRPLITRQSPLATAPIHNARMDPALISH